MNRAAKQISWEYLITDGPSSQTQALLLIPLSHPNALSFSFRYIISCFWFLITDNIHSVTNYLWLVLFWATRWLKLCLLIGSYLLFLFLVLGCATLILIKCCSNFRFCVCMYCVYSFSLHLIFNDVKREKKRLLDCFVNGDVFELLNLSYCPYNLELCLCLFDIKLMHSFKN